VVFSFFYKYSSVGSIQFLSCDIYALIHTLLDIHVADLPVLLSKTYSFILAPSLTCLVYISAACDLKNVCTAYPDSISNKLSPPTMPVNDILNQSCQIFKMLACAHLNMSLMQQ
jgi:hypothetical protein